MDYGKQANQRKRFQKEVDQQRLVSKIWLNILRIACIAILAAVFIVAGVLLGGFMGIIDAAPVRDSYEIEDFTSYIYDKDGNLMTPIYTSVMRSEASIDDIPLHMQHAVVAIEDSRFYQHNGIDIEGILRSGVLIFQGGDLQGGSTITQQVIKNLALSADTAMTRKIQEWYMALQYEYQLTQEMGQAAAKQHILETYLNYVNFGNGNYGVQSASRFYFNKNVGDISIAEAAVLAGVLNAPSYYDPVTEQKACRERQHLVLKAMYDQGYITESEYNAALREDVFGLITENTQSSPDDPEEEDSSVHYTFFQEAAISQVQEDLMKFYNMSEEEAIQKVYHGGLQIHLTQEQYIQDAIDYYVDNMTTLFNRVPTYYQLNYALSIYSEDRTSYDNFGLYNLLYDTEDEANYAVESYRGEKLTQYGLTVEDTDRYAESVTLTLEPQLSIIIMDPSTGQVVGMSAGRGEKTVDMALNRATDSTRQPGSTFKVLSAFAPALDGAGRTAATVFVVVPLNPEETGGWSPYNWWSRNLYFGFATIRQGIANSMNLIAARCIMDIGPDLAYEYVTEHFGITSLVGRTSDSDGDVTATMALGGLVNGVTNLELANAFASIANSGTYIKASFYTKVYDHNGDLLLDKTPEGSQVESHQALSEQNAWIVENMMRSAVRGGSGLGYETATNLRISDGTPIAAKTGTTNDSADFWLVGWTPRYLFSLWQGYDMIRYTGDYGSLTTRYNSDDRDTFFNGIMNAVHENLEYSTFEDPPEGITTATVCSKSGLLATGSCGSYAYTEYFVEGTVPGSYCNVHVSGERCTVSGLAPNPDGTCTTEPVYGVRRSYDLAELEKILEVREPNMGFKASYVRDYVPSTSSGDEVCPGGHKTENSGEDSSGDNSGDNSSGGNPSGENSSGDAGQ